MKKKKLMKQVMSLLREFNGPSIAASNGEDASTEQLNRAMVHNSDMSWTIHSIHNGYNVVFRSRKFDRNGHATSDATTVHYVQVVDDIPKLMASTGAAFKMGL